MAQVLAKNECQRVIQKYIERPLLIAGHKFDLRCWVMVTDWASLSLYFYDTDCLIRLCSEPFALDDVKNTYAHITNRAVQQHRFMTENTPSQPDGGAVMQCDTRFRDVRQARSSRRPGLVWPQERRMGAMRRMASPKQPRKEEMQRCPHPHQPQLLPPFSMRAAEKRDRIPLAGALWSGNKLHGHLRDAGFGNIWGETVLPAMKGVAAATMRCGVERADPRRNSFELYGLDMVLDDAFRPWLIEV